MPPRRIVATVILILAMSACAGGDKNEEEAHGPDAVRAAGLKFADIGGNQAIADLFNDGELDDADYETAFNAFQECVTASGMSLQNVVKSPLDQLTYAYEIHYNALTQDAGATAATTCFDTSLALVQDWYTETNRAQIAAPIRDSIVQCVAKAGYEVAPEADSLRTLGGPDATDLTRFDDVSNCASSAMSETYPEILSYAISF